MYSLWPNSVKPRFGPWSRYIASLCITAIECVSIAEMAA
jgi:hypothetical protein